MAVLIGLLFCLSLATSPVYADKKKKEQPAAASRTVLDRIDFSKLVWPNPPAPTRVKYLNYFCCCGCSVGFRGCSAECSIPSIYSRDFFVEPRNCCPSPMPW